MSGFESGFGFAESKEGSGYEAECTPWLNGNLVAVGRLDPPWLVAQVPEPPDLSIGMADDLGHRSFEVVVGDPGHMMAPQPGCVAHGNPPAISELESHGGAQRPGTCPAGHALDFRVEEVLGTTPGTQHDAVLETRHRSLPDTLPHPSVTGEHTICECGSEELADSRSQRLPVRSHRSVVIWVGTVAVVRRMEDEDRLSPEHHDLRVLVPCREFQLPPTQEGVADDQDVEQQNREGPQVGDGARLSFASDDLGCHEFAGSQDGRGRTIVDGHIVVVTDQRPARHRVEKDIGETDVPITKPLAVEVEEAVGKVAAEGGPYRRANLDPPLEQGCQSHELGRAKRHQVAKGMCRIGVDDLAWPEEAGSRRPSPHETLDGEPLLFGTGGREIPLERLVGAPVVEGHLKDRALPPFADETFDAGGAPAHREGYLLAYLEHRITCLESGGELSGSPLSPARSIMAVLSGRLR